MLTVTYTNLRNIHSSGHRDCLKGVLLGKARGIVQKGGPHFTVTGATAGGGEVLERIDSETVTDEKSSELHLEDQ